MQPSRFQDWDKSPAPESPAFRDLGPGKNESHMDMRFRGAYEAPDVPPTFEYDRQGNVLLRVEPGSIQSKLMTRANLLLIWRKTEALRRADNSKEEALDLRAEVKHLETLNARLREPDDPDQLRPPKPGLRQRIGQTVLNLTGSHANTTTGNTFVNTDATLLLHNLSLAAADLRAQVSQGAVLDPGKVSDTAEDMIDLGTSTRMLIDDSPAPQQNY